MINNDDFQALENEVNEVKKSVSDGKTLVAAAITRKDVQTAATDTFAKMAENIGAIENATIISGNVSLSNHGEYACLDYFSGLNLKEKVPGKFIVSNLPKKPKIIFGVYRSDNVLFPNPYFCIFISNDLIPSNSLVGGNDLIISGVYNATDKSYQNGQNIFSRFGGDFVIVGGTYTLPFFTWGLGFVEWYAIV